MRKTGSKFLDSSAWLAYFYQESTLTRDIIEGEDAVFTSAISLYEVIRKLRKRKTRQNLVQSFLTFMQDRSMVVEITNEVSIVALNWPELDTIDAFIYASAYLQKATLYTCDLDFKGLSGVEILDRKL